MKSITEDQAITMTAAGIFLVGYRMVDAASDIGSEVMDSFNKGPLGKTIGLFLPALGGFMKGISKATETDWNNIPENIEQPMKTFHALMSSNMATGVGVGLLGAGVFTYTQLHPELVERYMAYREGKMNRRAELVDQMIEVYGEKKEDLGELVTKALPALIAG